MRITVTTMALLLACAANAWARPALEIDEPGIQLPSVELAGPQPTTRSAGDRQEAVDDRKKPAVAVFLALTATAAPMLAGGILLGSDLGDTAERGGFALLALGATLGPSAGHIYAGEYVHGALTAGIRVAAATGGFLSLAVGAIEGLGAGGPNYGLMVLGVGLIGGAGVLALYDLVDAGFAARRANEQRKASLRAAPVIARDPQGRTQYGLALAGRF